MAAQRMNNLSGGSCPFSCVGLVGTPSMDSPWSISCLSSTESNIVSLTVFEMQACKGSAGGTGPCTPPSRRRSGSPTDSVTLAEASLHAKFHLDRLSRLDTTHARYRHIHTGGLAVPLRWVARPSKIRPQSFLFSRRRRRRQETSGYAEFSG